ncbi:peptide chain release factor N(5)-glutamine methyltransferase [Bacteroidota bacterium]
MLKVLEAIQLSTDYLNKKGIESPRINAELLLADILNCSRLNLYLMFDRPLSEDQKTEYREMIARRGKFEPLQYILGYVEFYGLKFNVNPSVLIPRQETEILIETIIEEYNDLPDLKIFDIGTGSGNIPVCLAKNLQEVKITAVDISTDALAVAKENASLHDVNNNITFLEGDILNGNCCEDIGQFDLIVSNPPYVGEDQYKEVQKEILENEPAVAVTDYADGYKFYNTICESAPQFLKKNGKIFFEMGIGQSESVKSIMEKNGFHNIKIKKDYLDIDRVIYGELK